MDNKCKVPTNEQVSAICAPCLHRVCNSKPIAEHILGSGDTVKINNLNKVLSKYELRVQDYI